MDESRHELLAVAETHFLRIWADVIADASEIQLIRGPATGLVAMQVRDSVVNRPFIAGDVRIIECWVSVDGVRGFGFCLGDDPEKALAAAVIDGACNGDHPWLGEMKEALQRKAVVLAKRREQEAELVGRWVDFKVMEG